MQSTQASTRDAASTIESGVARRDFWFIGGLLIFCFLCAFFQVSDVDVGYHVRTGEHILAGHGIPAQNTFSYTVPNEPWLLQQWLGATIYSLVHRVGGVTGLVIFKALVATLLMFLVWRSARDATEKKSLWPLWAVTGAVLVARVRFFERPDLFTSVLFALTFFLDQRFGKNRRWQWLFLPLLMAVWVHVHAGWVYGMVLLGVLAAAEWIEFFIPKLQQLRGETAPRVSFRELLVRPLGIVLSLVALVISVQLINPNGWQVLTVPFTQFTSTFWQSAIIEYQPPTWSNGKLFYVALALLAILQAATWRHFRLRYFLATAVFGYFAISSQRSISAFTLVAVPHAAFMLSRLPKISLPQFSRLARPLLPLSWAALTILMILPDKTYRFGAGLYHPYYPTEIFRFVEREVPPQNLFNDMRFGGPMLWTLYPRFQPFIDGRGDGYSEQFWKTEYLPAVQGEDSWAEIFEKHHVTGALLSAPEPTKVSRLAKTLFDHPDWALVAYNDETLLFLKRTDANLSVIERHAFKHLWPGNWNLGEINNDSLSEMAREAVRAYDLYPGMYAHAVAARCAMLAGDFSNASELFAHLIKQPGASAAFWSDYAFCLYQSKRHDQAEKVLGEMIQKGLAVGFAYYLKHFLALERQQPAEAKALLAKAIESEPENKSYRDAMLRFQSAASNPDGRSTS